MRTSYSAIDTYLQCPQKYKFQEIDRIKAAKSKEALFGTLIHQTLAFMFKKDPLFPTLDEVFSYFREHWPLLETFNKESTKDTRKRPWTEEEMKTYFDEGVRMIKNFYQKNTPWNFSVVDLESRFEIALEDEKNKETHILAGIMDRIDKHSDGHYEIIDYKTSRRMPSQDALDKNLQLSLYALGLQKRWPHIKPEEITLSLYFLKHGEKLSTEATEGTTQKTKEHVLATLNEIKERSQSGKGFEPMPGPLCDWCAYRPICPAWRHLYKKIEPALKNEEVEKTIETYFELKDNIKESEEELSTLQEKIKKYMEREHLTRVFGEKGIISKKTIARYEYDLEKIKSILSPLGKWEDILKADEIKLKQIMKEVPENVRKEIESARKVKKEITMLSATTKKFTEKDSTEQN